MSKEETPKKKFEVKMRIHPNGEVEKQIFIDDEMLDWSVDISSLLEAKKMGPKFLVAARRSIAEHFLKSVSEVLGRKITIDDIKEATKTGWI